MALQPFEPIRVAAVAALVLTSGLAAAAEDTPRPAAPLIDEQVVFEEVDGVVAVEAEHFFRQQATDTRAWYLFAPGQGASLEPDADPPHLPDASGGAYLEILPDTRQRPSDELKFGENFAPNPARKAMAVLSYKVHFNTPGRYYVWARIYSTGADDNGLHVGLDGEWPESGQRMQWIAKRRWAWDSKQRTNDVHTGVKHGIYFDIDKPGEHIISFAMREDGTEFDKWMMVNRQLDKIEGQGPATKLKSGKLPEPFPSVEPEAAAEPNAAPAGGAQARPSAPGAVIAFAARPADQPPFDPETDLISLHYDHAPDKDDGQSAAADRTMLQTHFGPDWMKAHAVAVSGACGLNRKTFNRKSDAVMDATFNDVGGWLAAHDDWDNAVAALVERWGATLAAGGDVWVKEGGQSDITAEVVRQIRIRWPDVDTTRRIHVIQHGKWNETNTTPEALAYTKANTRYVKIPDANRYLNIKGGRESFEAAALSHPVFGPSWRAAFDYYPPKQRLDFSDTGELMHILGVGEIDIDAFRGKYLDPQP